MARRKDHTREELHELAVRCGREIVAAGGPDALTARSVAGKMGYTPGTLYNLFENLEGLIIAINIGTLDELGASIHAVLENGGKPRKILGKIAEAYLSLQARHPHLWALLFATPVSAKSDEYHQAIHRVFDPVVQVLRSVSADDAAARRDAKILWATLHGICHLKQSGKLDVTEEDPPEVLVKQFLKQFLRR